MIFARVVNHWIVETRVESWDACNMTFETQDDVDRYLAENEQWKPQTIYAQIENNWPVMLSDTDWPGRNQIFTSAGEFNQFCDDNALFKPAPVVVVDEKTDAQIWQEKLDGGWLDQLTNIKLKTNKEARDLFTGQVVMLREALDACALTADAELSIWDYYEQEHVLTVAQLRGLLLRYGIAWKQMFDDFAP